MNLRELEANSIRDFVQRAANEGYLSGTVLDVGAGLQPYRDIVEAAGGEYVPFDAPSFPAAVAGLSNDTTGLAWGRRFETLLCTQVVQYVEDVALFLQHLRWERTRLPAEGGCTLVLTYPTNWPEVEPEDLHRFTKAGMERLLTEAGFTIISHTFRHGFQHDGVSFTCGYGVIAHV
jgi:hypothetical protein